MTGGRAEMCFYLLRLLGHMVCYDVAGIVKTSKQPENEGI